MRIIQILSERIEEELDDSFEYIEMAIQYKEEFPQIAKTFYELSVEEMRHMEMLHIEVAALIKKHREEHGDPPASMMAVYEFLHKKDIEKSAKIKLLQNHFREM
jgi:rubrerythrin